MREWGGHFYTVFFSEPILYSIDLINLIQIGSVVLFRCLISGFPGKTTLFLKGSMELFIKKQQEIYPVSSEGMEMLLRDMTEVECRKGEIIVSEGQRIRDAYFVKQGLVRAYVEREDKEVTLWFASVGDMAVGGTGGILTMNVEALEDCVFLKIPQARLEDLYHHSLELANWGRKLLEKYLLEYEHYFTHYSWNDASEQYEMLLKADPELLQKVPLKYIASYLQITPQSLSRIRAKNK